MARCSANVARASTPRADRHGAPASLRGDARRDHRLPARRRPFSPSTRRPTSGPGTVARAQKSMRTIRRRSRPASRSPPKSKMAWIARRAERWSSSPASSGDQAVPVGAVATMRIDPLPPCPLPRRPRRRRRVRRSRPSRRPRRPARRWRRQWRSSGPPRSSAVARAGDVVHDDSVACGEIPAAEDPAPARPEGDAEPPARAWVPAVIGAVVAPQVWPRSVL